MKPEDLQKIQGETARDTIRLRANAVKSEQQSLTPPLVPRADPPTTMAEVPPGTQQYRAAPVKLPDRAKDPAAEGVKEAESEGTREMKENAAKDAGKLESIAGKH